MDTHQLHRKRSWRLILAVQTTLPFKSTYPTTTVTSSFSMELWSKAFSQVSNGYVTRKPGVLYKVLYREAPPWGPTLLKPWPNDRNMSTQHIATLFGATCFAGLATLLQRVATCWVCLKWPNLSQQHPTCRNRSQQGGQTRATCCAQQCCDMLRWHVAIVWPGLNF